MTKKRSIMLAISGAALVAASQAQAQQTPYSDEDLVLNFRSINSATPPNVAVDLGNVTAFITAVAALSNDTVVLDEPGVTAGYTDQFTAADMLSAIGSPSSSLPIGFSAGAAQASSSTLWLTRVIEGPTTTNAGLTESAGQTASAQGATAQIVGDIGQGYDSPNGTQLGSGNAAIVSSGNTLSYSTLTIDGTGAMSYNATQTITAGAGGPIEGVQTGSGNVYEALWKVNPLPNARSAPNDVYEGYFTFQPDGEVDFTGTSSVIQPSTNLLSLTIVASGPSSVTVLWTNTGSYTLQQSSNLAVPAGWTTSGYTVTTTNGVNSITIAPATGDLFFRLVNP
jgi:hypothetical protein